MAAKRSGLNGAQPKQLVYILYDDRANYDVDEASVLFSDYDLAEVRERQRVLGGVLYVYTLVDGVATNGRPVTDDDDSDAPNPDQPRLF